jgi:hypothetical protein
MMPRAGGEYVFIRDRLRPALGFSVRVDAVLHRADGIWAALAVGLHVFLNILTGGMTTRISLHLAG